MDRLQTAMKAATKTARKFARQVGADKEETTAEAMVPMIEAQDTYTGQVEYARHVSRRVRQHLVDRWRKDLTTKRGHGLKRHPAEAVTERRRFDLGSLLFQLSEDAGDLVRLVLTPTPDIEEGLPEGPGGYPLYKSLARLVRKHALGVLGWDEKRFTRAWKEVREALN